MERRGYILQSGGAVFDIVKGVQFVKGRVMLDEVEGVYTFCEVIILFDLRLGRVYL